MLLLKQKSFEVESAGDIVKAEDAATLANAEAIIAAATHEAELIHEDALKATEEERKRGYEQGLADGKREIMMQKLDLLDESVTYMQGIEDKMAGIVMNALRKCLDEIGDKELVVQIVKKAMHAVVRNQKEITLKVAPDMVETVRARMNDILARFPGVTFADVEADAKLRGSACVVETEAGSVEASAETQLEAIERSIEKHFNRTNGQQL